MTHLTLPAVLYQPEFSARGRARTCGFPYLAVGLADSQKLSLGT